jgi:hypothetical protein
MATSGYDRYKCGITLTLRLFARRTRFHIADKTPGICRSGSALLRVARRTAKYPPIPPLDHCC